MSSKSLKEYYDEYKTLEGDHDKAVAYAEDQVNRDRDRIPGPLVAFQPDQTCGSRV
jgi:hypothetical protein